ncbi:MAG: hypothetical protein WD708_05015 [Kiritimatiellia bacterium]
MNKQDAQKINEALELLNQAAHGQKEEFTSLLTDKFSELKKAVLDLESNLGDEAKEGLERLKSLREAASEQTKTAAVQVDRKVHEDPWKTFGWAVVGAFAIGILLGRKD